MSLLPLRFGAVSACLRSFIEVCIWSLVSFSPDQNTRAVTGVYLTQRSLRIVKIADAV